MRSRHARASGSRSRVRLPRKSAHFDHSPASWYCWRLLRHLDELAHTRDERSNIAARLLATVGVETGESFDSSEAVLALIAANEPSKLPLEAPYGRNLHQLASSLCL